MGPNFPFSVFRSRKPCFWFCLGKVATFPSNFFGVGLGKIRPNFSRGKVARKLGFHCTHSSQKQSPKQLTRCVTVTQRSPLTFFSLFRFLSFQPIRSLATENVFRDFPRKLVAKKANFPPSFSAPIRLCLRGLIKVRDDYTIPASLFQNGTVTVITVT